jgi:hypothetical protein
MLGAFLAHRRSRPPGMLARVSCCLPRQSALCRQPHGLSVNAGRSGPQRALLPTVPAEIPVGGAARSGEPWRGGGHALAAARPQAAPRTPCPPPVHTPHAPPAQPSPSLATRCLAIRAQAAAPPWPCPPSRRARARGARRRLARPPRRHHRPAARPPGRCPSCRTPRPPCAPPLTRLRPRRAAQVTAGANRAMHAHAPELLGDIARGMSTPSLLLATLGAAGSSLSRF